MHGSERPHDIGIVSFIFGVVVSARGMSNDIDHQKDITVVLRSWLSSDSVD